MLESPEQLDLPQQLKDLILDEKCVAFVGSGLSAGCYPSWAELFSELQAAKTTARRIRLIYLIRVIFIYLTF